MFISSLDIWRESLSHVMVTTTQAPFDDVHFLSHVMQLHADFGTAIYGGLSEK